MATQLQQLEYKSRAGQVLTMDEVRILAPSAFAENAAPTTSDRYRYIPTSEPLNALVKAGFQIVGAGESKTRIAGNENFVRHMIRLRPEPSQFNHQMVRVGQIIPQVVLLNSHNGTSAYHLYAALFRLVCLNGMVVKSHDMSSIRVLHSGKRDMQFEVLEASEQIVKRLPDVLTQIESWQGVQWDAETMHEYARAAMLLRWDDPKIQTYDVLYARRAADRGDNVWSVMNRVQENLMQGGTRYYSAGRRNRTRPVNSVNADLSFNTRLWDLTDRWVRGDRFQPESVIEGEYTIID